MKVALLGQLAALVLTLCAACGGELLEESVLEDPTPSIEHAPVEDTEMEEGVLKKPTPSIEDAPVLGKSVLKKLTPSLVTIQFRRISGGSGFLVKGNYVVTAAHVVWGFPEIDVLLHDGTLKEDVPVIAYDYFTDLAFLGPIDTSAPPLQFAEIDNLTREDKAFIFGDPRGPGGHKVSEGNYYTTKDWPKVDATILYVSAEAELGMSGGPMTNEEGEVMGVLVHRHGGGFTSGPSSDTVKDRLEKLAQGEDITILGNRELPDAREGSQEFEFVLRDRWDTATFVSVGSNHSLEFDSYRDVEYGFFDIHGNGAFSPSFRSTQDRLTNQCCLTGPGFVEVRQLFDIERHVTLRSEAPLIRRDDPDDGRELRVGRTVTGAIDTPGDIDRYTIDLFGGESIALKLSGLKSLLVTIDHPHAPPYDTVSQELYIEEIEYRAPVNTTYTVTLQMSPDSFGSPVGYTLTALDSTWYPRRRDDSAVLDSPAGDMLRHKFDHPVPTIQIDYPVNITGGDKEVIAAELFEQDRWGRTVTLEKRDLSHHRQEPNEELSVSDYMERSVLSGSFPYKTEKTVTARREIETASGAPVLIEDFEVDNGGMKGVRLAYIHEGETGFMAIFYAPGEVFDEWRPVVDYCIGTFSVGDFSVADAISSE